jgi:hypothetical protein
VVGVDGGRWLLDFQPTSRAAWIVRAKMGTDHFILPVFMAIFLACRYGGSFIPAIPLQLSMGFFCCIGMGFAETGGLLKLCVKSECSRC